MADIDINMASNTTGAERKASAAPRRGTRTRSPHIPRTHMPNANLHILAAKHLRAYVDVMDMAYAGTDDPWWQERHEVMRAIRQLDETSPCWETPKSFADAAGAARIVYAMLQDWGMAGAIWYTPRIRRFRLVGTDYQRDIGEVCVGVYASDVTIAALTEDFEDVLREPQHSVNAG